MPRRSRGLRRTNRRVKRNTMRRRNTNRKVRRNTNRKVRRNTNRKVRRNTMRRRNTNRKVRRNSRRNFRRMRGGASVDDQMRISQEYNRKSPEEKKAANMKVLGTIKKVKREKDTRTDAQKMTDATGPRPGSRYRGD